ncbi:MAG TPA: ABC transporter substrate-binding protein, partial [Candidatus Acidoferrum sp.]|nr:ABC transporter substrate-binding protein [Candidatus Acidoferrum sp.]
TGAACTPYGFLWARGTHALAVSTGGALVKTGGDTWYFITVDYAFGHAMEEDASRVIEAGGGKVLGHVLYPLNAPDFSSFLLRAQSLRAKIIGLANGGTDAVNSIKQAAEFGIVAGGQRLAAFALTAAEVHGLGLQAAQGLVLADTVEKLLGLACFGWGTGRDVGDIFCFCLRPVSGGVPLGGQRFRKDVDWS